MKLEICNYILLFFIYSFVGWIVEIIYTKITTKDWVNRGFLIGPLCPIYGWGVILLVLLLDRYHNDYFALFLGAIFICSLLEYWTSYFLEKIFHARWWDYSHLKYNINGRICLETMLPFGFFGMLIVGFINPFVTSKINLIPLNFKLIFVIILLIIFMIDNIISFSVLSKIKDNIKFINSDNTDEIKKKIKQIFLSKSFIYRRLLTAFPDLFLRHINFKKLESIRLKRKIKKGKS